MTIIKAIFNEPLPDGADHVCLDTNQFGSPRVDDRITLDGISYIVAGVNVNTSRSSLERGPITNGAMFITQSVTILLDAADH